MTVWTIIVAAGSGTRFGGPKQLASLGDQRVIDWSLAAADQVSDGVVVVASEDVADQLDGNALVADPIVVLGGVARSDSVRAGLAAVPSDATVIIVHDGARPLAEARLFEATVNAVRAGASGAIAAVPMTDSIRHETHGSVDRGPLRAVQTPQAFDAKALRDAHASGADATDDATLVEAAGGRIVLVAGSEQNLKITNPSDLAVAEALLAWRQKEGHPDNG